MLKCEYTTYISVSMDQIIHQIHFYVCLRVRWWWCENFSFIYFDLKNVSSHCFNVDLGFGIRINDGLEWILLSLCMYTCIPFSASTWVRSQKRGYCGIPYATEIFYTLRGWIEITWITILNGQQQCCLGTGYITIWFIHPYGMLKYKRYYIMYCSLYGYHISVLGITAAVTQLETPQVKITWGKNFCEYLLWTTPVLRQK